MRRPRITNLPYYIVFKQIKWHVYWIYPEGGFEVLCYEDRCFDSWQEAMNEVNWEINK